MALDVTPSPADADRRLEARAVSHPAGATPRVALEPATLQSAGDADKLESYPAIPLQAPSTAGFLMVAAEIAPPSRPGPVLRNRHRSAVIAQLRQRLSSTAVAAHARVFQAAVFAPATAFTKSDGTTVPPARFDVVALMQTENPAAADALIEQPDVADAVASLRRAAHRVEVTAAHNVKRIADVPAARHGLYLFNYFAAEDVDRALQVWDHLASWYAAETGLDNSMVLQPVQPEATYAFINHAHFATSLPRLMWAQLGKPSFRSYVIANLQRNRMVAMPVLYRVAP